MRLILDNNVVSLLCCGVARRIACSARQSAQSVLMHSSLPLLEELTNVLGRPFCLQQMALIGIMAQLQLARLLECGGACRTGCDHANLARSR